MGRLLGALECAFGQGPTVMLGITPTWVNHTLHVSLRHSCKNINRIQSLINILYQFETGAGCRVYEACELPEGRTREAYRWLSSLRFRDAPTSPGSSQNVFYASGATRSSGYMTLNSASDVPIRPLSTITFVSALLVSMYVYGAARLSRSRDSRDVLYCTLLRSSSLGKAYVKDCSRRLVKIYQHALSPDCYGTTVPEPAVSGMQNAKNRVF